MTNIERIEGLLKITTLDGIEDYIVRVKNDMLEEGWEKDDVVDYLTIKILQLCSE